MVSKEPFLQVVWFRLKDLCSFPVRPPCVLRPMHAPPLHSSGLQSLLHICAQLSFFVVTYQSLQCKLNHSPGMESDTPTSFLFISGVGVFRSCLSVPLDPLGPIAPKVALLTSYSFVASLFEMGFAYELIFLLVVH